MNRKIGIFDSGVGGTSILEELKKILPREDFFYYADTENIPYGSKTKEELNVITSKVAEHLINNNCKIIVIACNTATISSIDALREKYVDTVFIGVIPPIEKACESYNNILVMGTPYTIKSELVQNLVLENKKESQNIYLLPCDELANLIEQGNKIEIENNLKELLLEYSDKNIDCIVLGCTHYSLIKEEVSKMIPNAVLLDNAILTANKVREVLKEENKKT